VVNLFPMVFVGATMGGYLIGTYTPVWVQIGLVVGGVIAVSLQKGIGRQITGVFGAFVGLGMIVARFL
jgi:hypothetical protein